MDVGSLIEKLGPVGAAVVPALVIAAASIIDAVVPTPAENTPLWYVKKAISWLAMNIGNAKNAK
jgi:hypothetical protein